MPFGEAKDEIKLSDELWENSSAKALREQQETDWGWWSGSYEYKMGTDKTDEGEWESHTTNSGMIRANKLIQLLSSSYPNIFIDLDEETRKKRKKLSATEQLANGIIWQADRDAMRTPYGKPVLSSLSSTAVVRGGNALSLIWYEDKDDGGKPKCALRIYDPMFCQFIVDDDDITWFCYRDFINQNYINRHYEKQKKEGLFERIYNAITGSKGENGDPSRLQRYTFINDEEIRTACNGSWLDDGDKHGIGHVPVNIRSCGAIPLLSSEETTDTMKYSWQSYAVNTRKVYPLESKMLSIRASIALENARQTAMAEYDSLKSNDTPDIKAIGYGDKKRNKVIFFNAGKGHKFLGFADKPSNDVTDAFAQYVEARMDIAAGLDQQTLDMLARSGNTSLAAELRNAVEEEAAPFRKCVEESLIWLAEEGVSQFVHGAFSGTLTVQGKDRKRNSFYADDITKDSVEESKFSCNLVSSRAQDESLQTDISIKRIRAGLSSPQTEMVRSNISQDPDRELDNIAQANALKMAMADPMYFHDNMAAWYKEQGDERKALYHLSMSALAIQEAVQKAAGLLNPAAPGGNGEKQVEEFPGVEQQIPPAIPQA